MSTSPKAWRDDQNKPWIPLKYQQKYYPAANTWMWTYCTWLGAFTYNGRHYDLGLYLPHGYTKGISYAVVFGNEPGDYISGELTLDTKDPVQAETVRRGLLMGYIKPI